MAEITSDIDITEDEMLKFARTLALQPRKPGEMTAQILADATGRTKRWALDRMDKFEKLGLVTHKWIIENERRTKAYIPVSGKWSDLLK